MNDRKREILAGKFLDLGNYAIVALGFSQIVAETSNWSFFILGLLLGVLSLIVANLILP